MEIKYNFQENLLAPQEMYQFSLCDFVSLCLVLELLCVYVERNRRKNEGYRRERNSAVDGAEQSEAVQELSGH